jgi:hypothetical protein
VFDHVEAKILKQDAKGMTLLVKNPTQFEASVSVFAETSQQALKPLDYTAFVSWPKERLKAGETRQVYITAGGNVLQQ